MTGLSKSVSQSDLITGHFFVKETTLSSKNRNQIERKPTKQVKYMSALLLLEKINLNYFQKQESNPSDLSLGNSLILEGYPREVMV